MSILGLKKKPVDFHPVGTSCCTDVTLLHRIEMLPDVFFFFLNVINIIVKFLSNIVLCCLYVFF